MTPKEWLDLLQLYEGSAVIFEGQLTLRVTGFRTHGGKVST